MAGGYAYPAVSAGDAGVMGCAVGAVAEELAVDLVARGEYR